MAPLIGSKVKFSIKTQEQYNAIVSKNPNTIYFTSDEKRMFIGADEYCKDTDGVVDFTETYDEDPNQYGNNPLTALLELTARQNKRAKYVNNSMSIFVSSFSAGNNTFSIVEIIYSAIYNPEVLFYQGEDLVCRIGLKGNTIDIKGIQDLSHETQYVWGGHYDAYAVNKKYVDEGGGLNIYLTYNAGASTPAYGQYTFTTAIPSKYIYSALAAGKQIRIHHTDASVFPELHGSDFAVYVDPYNSNYRILNYTITANGSSLSVIIRFKASDSSAETATATARIIYSPVVVPSSAWSGLTPSLTIPGFVPSEGKLIYLAVWNNIYHNPQDFPYEITINGVTGPICYKSYELSANQMVQAYPGTIVGLYYDGSSYLIVNPDAIVNPMQ